MSYLGERPDNDVSINHHEYTATEGQTIFAVVFDDFVEVFVNGVKLSEDDFTKNSGVSITLATGATAGDIVAVNGFQKVQSISYYTEAEADSNYDQLSAEALGFAPRNLMDVFGTSTVSATFEALRASVSGGDFSHLRLGDYIDLDDFTILDWYNGAAYDSTTGAWDTDETITKNLSYENTRVEIVGFDDYYYVGNSAYPSAHHVTMMFKNIPITAPMHKINTSPYYQTSQNYKGSDLVTKGLAHWYTAISSQFGTATPYQVDRILGTVNSWEWCGAERLFLPTSVNIFGTTGFSHTNYGTGTQKQFPLYALNPSRIMKRRNGAIRQSWWLAEPSAGSSAGFTYVYGYGYLSNYYSYYSYGVVPAFLI